LCIHAGAQADPEAQHSLSPSLSRVGRLSPAASPAPTRAHLPSFSSANWLSPPGSSPVLPLSSFFPGAQRPEIPSDLPSSGPARQGSAAALHKGNPYALVPQNSNPSRHQRPQRRLLFPSAAQTPRPHHRPAVPSHPGPPHPPQKLPLATWRLPEPSICALSLCTIGISRRNHRR
jgi:hypothetical protein